MRENIYKSYYLIRDLYFRTHKEPLQLTNKIGNSHTLQMRKGVFTGGSVAKNLPANAGGHWFNSLSRKIPHAMEQISLCTTTFEPEL